MKNSRSDKFSQIQELLKCPLCASDVQHRQNSFICTENHCFDISSKGYVNLLPHQRGLKGYTRDFFESRRTIMKAGFYDHILAGILEFLSKSDNDNINTILDTGCGEGYYSKEILNCTGKKTIAFDISSEAVKIACRGGNDVYWLVSDITRIPVKDNSIDCILNIFTPANYSEFHRILTKNGVLIKIIPGEKHLFELRNAVKDHINNSDYSNQQVVEYFSEHFTVLERVKLTKTLLISPEQLKDFFHMTPLLFGVDTKILKNSLISQITIDGELLAGKKTDL